LIEVAHPRRSIISDASLHRLTDPGGKSSPIHGPANTAPMAQAEDTTTTPFSAA